MKLAKIFYSSLVLNLKHNYSCTDWNVSPHLCHPDFLARYRWLFLYCYRYRSLLTFKLFSNIRASGFKMFQGLLAVFCFSLFVRFTEKTTSKRTLYNLSSLVILFVMATPTWNSRGANYYTFLYALLQCSNFTTRCPSYILYLLIFPCINWDCIILFSAWEGFFATAVIRPETCIDITAHTVIQHKCTQLMMEGEAHIQNTGIQLWCGIPVIFQGFMCYRNPIPVSCLKFWSSDSWWLPFKGSHGESKLC